MDPWMDGCVKFHSIVCQSPQLSLPNCVITRAVLFSLSGLNCAKAQGLDPGIVHDGRYTVQSVTRSSIVRLIDLDLIVSSVVTFHLIIVDLGVHAFNVQWIVGVEKIERGQGDHDCVHPPRCSLLH